MKRYWIIPVLFGALCVPRPVTAQLSPVPDAMEGLGFLLGEWEGDGWIERAPGQRLEFRGTERVERRMGGRLIVVEGEFTAPIGPGGREVPVHQALGIFSYDRERETLSFRTYLARGPGRGHDIEDIEVGGPESGRIRWGYEDPGLGSVRYTIVVGPDDVWHEIGEARRGDAPWRQFFEMLLVRRNAR